MKVFTGYYVEYSGKVFTLATGYSSTYQEVRSLLREVSSGSTYRVDGRSEEHQRWYYMNHERSYVLSLEL